VQVGVALDAAGAGLAAASRLVCGGSEPPPHDANRQIANKADTS
jgi:hypothetical protein